MNDKWVGYIVSVHMKNNFGIYQGQISEATDSTLTLVKAFLNGVPHTKAEVVLNAADIDDIKLIDSKPKIQNGSSIVTVAKPVAKRMGRSISMCENSTNVNKNCVIQNNLHMNHVNHVNMNQVKQMTNIETNENHDNGSTNLNKNNTPLKKDKWKKNRRDEACFGNNVESSVPDFDFEKNLALFNKQKVWEEINLAKPDVLQSTGRVRNKSMQKYRHDENVIQTNPTALRQIIVPAPDGKEYVTDDGLIIPSVTYELRRQLFSAAERRGLSCEKQVELMGRAATEMAIQLLGGGHRLNPYNTHQFPTVVILSGPNRQGAVGLNCARQLSSHSINTIVFLAPTTKEELPILKSELSLYKLTNHKIITSVDNLPANTDLIILALSDDSENPKSYPLISEWVKQNRSPVLALDPPTVGTPGISTKFSLVPVLPLSYENENGKIYLCNIGFPTKIYKDVAIKYRSPFGPKFVIPLHPNDL